MNDTNTNITIEYVKKSNKITVGNIPNGTFFTGKFDEGAICADCLFLKVGEKIEGYSIVSIESNEGMILLEFELGQVVYNYCPRKVKIIVE